MTKRDEYREEREKLTDLFKDIEPNKAKLAEGLIEEAAFLRVQNKLLREQIVETGMIKIHPQHKDIQKPIETAKQYLRNVNSYATVIKTLNGIASKNLIEDDDEFEKFLKENSDE